MSKIQSKLFAKKLAKLCSATAKTVSTVFSQKARPIGELNDELELAADSVFGEGWSRQSGLSNTLDGYKQLSAKIAKAVTSSGDENELDRLAKGSDWRSSLGFDLSRHHECGQAAILKLVHAQLLGSDAQNVASPKQSTPLDSAPVDARSHASAPLPVAKPASESSKIISTLAGLVSPAPRAIVAGVFVPAPVAVQGDRRADAPATVKESAKHSISYAAYSAMPPAERAAFFKAGGKLANLPDLRAETRAAYEAGRPKPKAIKTLSYKDFSALSPTEKSKFCAEGGKLADMPETDVWKALKSR